MKNQTEKDFQQWILRQIEFYKPFLGLQLYNIEVNNGGDDYLELGFHYPYLDSKIKYSEKAFNNWKKNKFKRVEILHELLHLITDPLYSKASDRYVGKNEIEDERERLTDTLANIIDRLIQE